MSGGKGPEALIRWWKEVALREPLYIIWDTEEGWKSEAENDKSIRIENNEK